MELLQNFILYILSVNIISKGLTQINDNLRIITRSFGPPPSRVRLY